ncbi:anti-sigma F factor [Candidatus Arthromitus sp. SFB-rat-Yit]|uniref:anti-sigma F factor n=1 Tax=Candidatus Arthromitus sp. SFB-rat-Yit TaxID=1041504 RepID=UPI000227A28D|nr:anti-sigma F factor [Candidatus Arthromitus sp. SFB-rat-Yit]BAK81429.1 anti-sigma F factor [Candidatus Arthromitus sp. SFB-rat-Yit]
MQNSMSLTLSSRSSNESFARVAVAAFIAQLDPTLEEISDVKTAVSEAVTNAIIHGYNEDKNTNVVINVGIEDNEEDNNDNDKYKVTISIIDYGCGIDNIDQAREPLYTSRPDLERSGMGFSVMESFMDELYVDSSRDKGTHIKMVKYIKK